MRPGALLTLPRLGATAGVLVLTAGAFVLGQSQQTPLRALETAAPAVAPAATAAPAAIASGSVAASLPAAVVTPGAVAAPTLTVIRVATGADAPDAVLALVGGVGDGTGWRCGAARGSAAPADDRALSMSRNGPACPGLALTEIAGGVTFVLRDATGQERARTYVRDPLALRRDERTSGDPLPSASPYPVAAAAPSTTVTAAVSAPSVVSAPASAPASTPALAVVTVPVTAPAPAGAAAPRTATPAPQNAVGVDPAICGTDARAGEPRLMGAPETFRVRSYYMARLCIPAAWWETPFSIYQSGPDGAWTLMPGWTARSSMAIEIPSRTALVSGVYGIRVDIDGRTLIVTARAVP